MSLLRCACFEANQNRAPKLLYYAMAGKVILKGTHYCAVKVRVSTPLKKLTILTTVFTCTRVASIDENAWQSVGLEVLVQESGKNETMRNEGYQCF